MKRMTVLTACMSLTVLVGAIPAEAQRSSVDPVHPWPSAGCPPRCPGGQETTGSGTSYPGTNGSNTADTRATNGTEGQGNATTPGMGSGSMNSGSGNTGSR